MSIIRTMQDKLHRRAERTRAAEAQVPAGMAKLEPVNPFPRKYFI
jgi:hypothetical protein